VTGKDVDIPLQVVASGVLRFRGVMCRPLVCSEPGRRHDSGVSGQLQLGNGQNTSVWIRNN
jgi:hypothetical protein